MTSSTSSRSRRRRSGARPASAAVSSRMRLDGRVGALARRTAGAVGDRHEVRPQRREPLDGLPERALHLVGLRREELERARGGGVPPAAAGTLDGGQLLTPTLRADATTARRGSRASHMKRSSLVPRVPRAARSATQCDVEAGRLDPLPRSSRARSRDADARAARAGIQDRCGAKSTISSRPADGARARPRRSRCARSSR